MHKYPQMLYRIGNEIQFEGHGFDTLTVDDDGGFDAATAAGWRETPALAVKASQDAADPVPVEPEPVKAVDKRAELEAEAKALGISFRASISDDKLSERIAEHKVVNPDAATGG